MFSQNRSKATIIVSHFKLLICYFQCIYWRSNHEDFWFAYFKNATVLNSFLQIKKKNLIPFKKNRILLFYCLFPLYFCFRPYTLRCDICCLFALFYFILLASILFAFINFIFLYETFLYSLVCFLPSHIFIVYHVSSFCFVFFFF